MMRMSRIAMIALLAVAGCAAGESQEAENGSAAANRTGAEAAAYLAALEARFAAPGVVTAGLGGTARLGDVTVRPLAILEDSRCPQDVDCVHSGRLRLRVAIMPAPGRAELALGEAYRLPSAGTITLVVAAPERWFNPPPAGIDPHAAPRFGFRREGN
jgi:hypothetical protein